MMRGLGLALVGAMVGMLVSSGDAAAQQDWLLGNWLYTSMDPRGVTNSAIAARFEPGGRLVVQIAVSGTGGSGSQNILASWRMTGPQSYMTQIVDYGPKESCGAMGCLPVPPIFPIGMTQNCRFEPINQVAMMVSCDGEAPVRFTRQN